MHRRCRRRRPPAACKLLPRTVCLPSDAPLLAITRALRAALATGRAAAEALREAAIVSRSSLCCLGRAPVLRNDRVGRAELDGAQCTAHMGLN